MSSDRLILEHRKPLSLSRAHKRLAAFLDRQTSAQPALPLSPVDDAATAAHLRAVDRVKVHDHIAFQLATIRDAVLEDRQREKGRMRVEGAADAREPSGRQAVAQETRGGGSGSGGGGSRRAIDSTGAETEGARRKDKKRKSSAVSSG